MRNIIFKIGILLTLTGLIAFLSCTVREGKEKDYYEKLSRTGKTGETVTVVDDDTEMQDTGGREDAGGSTSQDRKDDFELIMYQTGTEKSGGVEVPAYDWEALEEINHDIDGWIYLPDSPIDFPVVHAMDSNYYLNHAFNGEESIFGCPFMDRYTFWDHFNRVIYGHSISSDSDAMFSPLLNFKDRKYFDSHRTFYYTEAEGTPEAYQVFAVMDYNVNDIYEWDFREPFFLTEEEQDAWMDELKDRALYYREPGSKPAKLLTLSTCCRQVYGKDGRFLVFLAA